MAPNGKPASFVMQHQRSQLEPVVDLAPQKESNIRVKNECILFSQSIMSGRWNPANNVQAVEPTSATTDGPEPRILSKKRRDLINAEIRELQNLLPLKKSARERLSYLGILALTNTFIRKATFFKKECLSCDASMSCTLVPEFSSSLCGFLLVFNREGKILYSSDNILDYLGNTVVELASQGDSIYDFVDKEDHDQIRAQLDMPPHDDQGEARRLSFYCRMSTSRYMKTQMRSWKNKIVHVTGRYHRPEMSSDWSDTVFFAVCTPIESKPVTDVRHHPSPRATEFKAVHGPDMKFLEVPNTVETLLGYAPEELENTSWYEWVYPEDLAQARQQHLKFVKEDGSAFACVLRMVKKDGSLVWVDITAEKSQESISSSFVCNYIVINEEDVPYFRIHHNLLPFPEHYTEEQRQYLAYRSTLLSAAVNSDVNSGSTSPMTSPTAMSHPDPMSAHYAQQVFADNLDTKARLRQQIKRKMSSIDTPTYNTDMFGVPPNKMLIRATSDITYPASAYHSPLQHSSSYPEASYHPHVFYRPGFPTDESFMSQLQGTAAAPGYLYEGGYTTLAPVRPDTLTLRQVSDRSPVASSSPVNGHVTQLNQNNNVGMQASAINQQYQHQQQMQQQRSYSQQYSPATRETDYYQSNPSPCSQSSHSPAHQSPHSPLNLQMSPGRSPKRTPSNVVRPQVEGLFCEVGDIIESESSHHATSSCGSITTSPNAAIMQPCSEAYDAVTSCQQGGARQWQYSLQNRLQAESEMHSTSPYSRSSCASDVIPQPNGMCQTSMKEEPVGSPQHYNNVMSPVQQQRYSPSHSAYDVGSPTRCSPSGFKQHQQQQHLYSSAGTCASPNQQHVATEKPYQVQYSISPAHPSTMHKYQAAAAAFYAAAQQGHPRVDMRQSEVEWVKKYGNMTATEMLFCESEGSPYLA